MRAAELQGSCDTRAQFKEEAQRADPETEARWWLGLAGPSESLPAVPDMAAGRDRGDLAARQLVFLLPGKRGRRVGREHSGWRLREAFARASTGPRSPGECGPGFGAPHFAQSWSRVTPGGSSKRGSLVRACGFTGVLLRM